MTNELVILRNNQAVTSSLKVAEDFEKRHDHVLRDINNLEKDVPNFGEMFYESEIPDKYNRPRKIFYMNRDGFTLLAMGFTGKKALSFKLKYIQKFNEMEEKIKSQIALHSYMIDDPIKRAEKWIEEQREKQQLETQKLMLEQQVKEYEPKVTYYDKILQSPDTITITQIAKDYGLTANKLNKILHESEIQYKQSGQWLLYAKHADKGYTKSNTFIDEHGKTRLNTKWTQKGRLFIHGLLQSKGIIALDDLENEIISS